MTDDTEDTSVVEDVVPEMLALVKRRQPLGPYRFLGNCEGAFVAWELARQLTAAGEVVEFVGILDTPNSAGVHRETTDCAIEKSPADTATASVVANAAVAAAAGIAVVAAPAAG